MSTNLPKNFPGRPQPAGGSSLPKNFTPEMAAGAAAAAPSAAPAPDAGPAQPEVTRGEIAEHFARAIVAARDRVKGGSRRARLFVVEFPFNDFIRDVLVAFAQVAGADLDAAAEGPARDAVQRPLATLGSNVDLFVHYLNHGRDVTIFCSRSWMLPQSVLDIVDTTIRVPRFDAERFAAACADFYELPQAVVLDGDTEWVGSVVPRDFLLSSHATAAEIVPEVRRSMERRMARYAPDAVLELADFSGMEEARSWAASLIEEIRLARAGRLAWADVEGGVALAGPRGVGKSSLARVVAREAGMRYVETSALGWLGTEQEPDLDLERLIADFQEALAAVPTVFFIGDLEVFGAMPWRALTGVFMKHLQSLRNEPGLVVVGSVGDADALPMTLRQRGGFESIITVSMPNSQSLAKMYALMLRDKPNALSADDLDALGRLSLGLSGDGVELIVRRALRVARKDGNRPVTRDDLARVLVQELVGAESEDKRRMMAADELRNTAYHEAGHAILQLMHRSGAGLRYATIVPRASGALGFVMRGIDETRHSVTRQDLIESVRVALAGRAAEELLGGKDSVTTGCSSDLAQAAHYLRYLLTRGGLNGLLPLDLSFETSPELRAQAQGILDDEYAHVLAVLQQHRPLLDEFARLLIERQEVSGDELAALYRRHRERHADQPQPER